MFLGKPVNGPTLHVELRGETIYKKNGKGVGTCLKYEDEFVKFWKGNGNS